MCSKRFATLLGVLLVCLIPMTALSQEQSTVGPNELPTWYTALETDYIVFGDRSWDLDKNGTVDLTRTLHASAENADKSFTGVQVYTLPNGELLFASFDDVSAPDADQNRRSYTKGCIIRVGANRYRVLDATEATDWALEMTVTDEGFLAFVLTIPSGEVFVLYIFS